MWCNGIVMYKSAVMKWHLMKSFLIYCSNSLFLNPVYVFAPFHWEFGESKNIDCLGVAKGRFEKYSFGTKNSWSLLTNKIWRFFGMVWQERKCVVWRFRIWAWWWALPPLHSPTPSFSSFPPQALFPPCGCHGVSVIHRQQWADADTLNSARQHLLLPE